MTLDEAKKRIDFLLQKNELLILDNENRIGKKDLFSRGERYGLMQAKEILEEVE